MTNIWKEIKKFGKVKSKQINEVYDRNNECVSSEKDILKQTNEYLIENFHSKEQTEEQSLTNNLKECKNELLNDDKYNLLNKKRINSPLWHYLNKVNTERKNYLAGNITEKEVEKQ